MSTFSREILDLFVDSIDDSGEGKKALSACMLVSWSFCVRARSRLFSTVDLERDARGLLGLLRYEATGYPSLAACIRKLEVVWDKDFLDEDSSFAEEDKDKFAILLLLSHPTCKVAEIEMDFLLGDLSGIHPFGDAYRAMQAICSASTLRRLRLSSVSDFPLELFDIFQLEELHTYKAGFKTPSNPNSSTSSFSTTSLIDAHSQPPVSRLRRCAFRLPINIPRMWQQLRTSPFSSLQSLLVQLGGNLEEPNHAFNTLLFIGQETLENLILHLEPGFDSLQTHSYSLRPLKRLQQLTFVCRSSSGPRGANWATEALLESLATVKDVPVSLQHISVHLNFFFYKMDLASIQFRDERQRKDLLDALSNPRFTSVSNIEVVVQLSGMRNMDVEVPFLVNFKTQTSLEYPRIQIKTRRFLNFDNDDELRMDAENLKP